MKCLSCGSEWTVAKSLNKTIKTCPFCGQPTEYRSDEHQPKGYTNVDDFDIVGSLVRGYHGTESVVYVPDGIKETGTITPNGGAFAGNKTLQKLVFPKSLKKIGANACFGCPNLQEVVIPEGVTTIEKNAFYGCKSLKKITLPTSLSTIDWCAFRDCTSLETISIPGRVTVIGNYAFEGCSNLRSLDIQYGVCDIGCSAFEACTALTEVVLPPSLKKISSDAFKDCLCLSSVIIPDSVTNIFVYEPYDMGGPPFINCPKLVNVTHPDRFGAAVFRGSGYYQAAREREEQQLQQRLLANKSAEQEKQRIGAERLKNGRCPTCDVKLSFFGNKCSKCGRKY